MANFSSGRYFSTDDSKYELGTSNTLIPKVNTEEIQKKKKIVSDLMALRRMKYQQHGRQSSPLNLRFSPLPEIEDNIKPSDLESILQDTVLKEELYKLHGKEALNKATEHFSILSDINAKSTNKTDEAEFKRAKFVSNITQKRKFRLERDRQQRIRKQQNLIGKQIELTQQELTFLSKSGGDLTSSLDDDAEDLPKLVENTGKKLKSMERNLRVLKIKYANDLLAEYREKTAKAEMDALKAEHPEGFEVTNWIIDVILENVYDVGKKNEGNVYESELLEKLIDADKAQYEKLEMQRAKANASLEFMEAVVAETCADMVPEICEECFLVALITVVYPEDMVVQSSKLAVDDDKVGKQAKRKIIAAPDIAKQIDDSFVNMKQNREHFKEGLWYHTLTSIKGDKPVAPPAPQAPAPPTKKVEFQAPPPPVDSEGDLILISSENVKSKLDSAFGDSEIMKQHAANESVLWKTYQVTVPEVTIPPKRSKGVNVACLSKDHKMLALGSYQGDILVYDVTSEFTLVSSVISHGKNNSYIVALQWSLDRSRLVSLSSEGCVIVWSASYTPHVSKSDINSLGFSDSIYTSQQLTALCVLESSKADFKLKDVSFSNGASSSYVPSLIQFHPTLSSAASQDSIVVAMKNGIIMKCNLSNNFAARFTNTLIPGFRKDLAPAPIVLGQPPIATQKVLKIGQDVTVEVFRFHRCELVELCFAKNCEDMISLDLNLNLCQWKHKAEHLNSFGWFVPFKKYQLAFVEEILTSLDDDEVIFEDVSALRKGAKKTKSKKVVEQERKRALRELDDLDVKNRKPWYTDEFPDKLEKVKKKKPLKNITRIYSPPEDLMSGTSAEGMKFAVVTVKKDNGTLLKYAFRTYQSSNSSAVNLLQSHVAPSGERIYFMVLYNEHLPRTRRHVSIIELDLETMQLGNIGPIQVDISSQEYEECKDGGYTYFSLSRVDHGAGTEYICSNIVGNLYVHSLLTGRIVIRKPFQRNTENERTEYQLPPQVKRISQQSRLLYIKPDGDDSYLFVFPLLTDQSYAAGKVIKITDSSVEKERRSVQSTYKALSAYKRQNAGSDVKEVGWYKPEQAAQRKVWGHRELPLALYMELMLNTIIDVALSRATNVRMPQEMRKKIWKQDWSRMESYFASAEKL